MAGADAASRCADAASRLYLVTVCRSLLRTRESEEGGSRVGGLSSACVEARSRESREWQAFAHTRAFSRHTWQLPEVVPGGLVSVHRLRRTCRHESTACRAVWNIRRPGRH